LEKSRWPSSQDQPFDLSGPKPYRRSYLEYGGRQTEPTVKGFAADIKHLPRLTAVLVKACSRARELGLIENDAEGAE